MAEREPLLVFTVCKENPVSWGVIALPRDESWGSCRRQSRRVEEVSKGLTRFEPPRKEHWSRYIKARASEPAHEGKGKSAGTG
jgi:hypothetical protein